MLKALNTLLDLTNDGFTKIDEHNTEHFAAAGRLVLAMSTEVDRALRGCLQAQIGSGEDTVTRIVISDVRTSDVAKALKRIAISRGLAESVIEKMERLFHEIQKLRNIRDKVTHRACMVSGDRLAFHNAVLAKTDDAIEVDIYTISELNEFADYATRLGLRVSALLLDLSPVRQSPMKKAQDDLIFFLFLQDIVIALRQAGEIPDDKMDQLKPLYAKASAAIKTHTAAAEQIDPKFTELRDAVTSAITEVGVAFMMTLGGRDDHELLEIPPRLRE